MMVNFLKRHNECFNTASGTRCCNLICAILSAWLLTVSIPQAVRAVATNLMKKYYLDITFAFQYRKRYALLQPIANETEKFKILKFQYRKRYALLQPAKNYGYEFFLLPNRFQYRKRYALLQQCYEADRFLRYPCFNTASGTRCCNHILRNDKGRKFLSVSIPQAVRAVATVPTKLESNMLKTFQYRKRYALLQPMTV